MWKHPVSGPARPAPASPGVAKESPVPTENTPRASESSPPPLTLAIGELTPVPPSPLPPERIEGERATPADLGRLVEWLAYLGAALYRASAPETTTREMYKQLDAARDETGTFLTRAREGAGPPAQEGPDERERRAREQAPPEGDDGAVGHAGGGVVQAGQLLGGGLDLGLEPAPGGQEVELAGGDGHVRISQAAW